MPLLRPGAHFARHQIRRFLGTGEVADVYEAIDPDYRRCALKVLAGEVLDPKVCARFLQEAQALVRIDHAHVVRWHDVGIDDEGRPWSSREMVEGSDLRQLVRDAGGSLPVHRAVRLVRQVCEGMAFVHERGMIHRALRPENILVADGDLAKVTDFHWVKFPRWGVETANQEHRSSLYTAPEQSQGRPRKESDVYSLGIVLYEVIAGHNPIGSEAMGAMELCKRHIEYEPVPLATVVPEVPSALSALLQKTMAKDPSTRPSMVAFGKALNAVLWDLEAPRRAVAINRAPLPNRGRGFEPTDAMPAVGSGGTIPMAAVDPGGAAPAKDRPAKDRPASLPPAPWQGAHTQRSPSFRAPAPALPVPEVLAAERRSTGIPVESAVTRPSRRPRGLGKAVSAVFALLVVGMAVAFWLFRPSEGAVSAPASAPPPPAPCPPTVSSSAPSAAVSPSASVSASAARPISFSGSAQAPSVSTAPAAISPRRRRLLLTSAHAASACQEGSAHQDAHPSWPEIRR
jgi:hypothetical protein